MTTLTAILILLASGPGAPPTSPVDPGSSPESARRQVRRVMNSGLNFAERALAESGEFPPFGAVMLPDGLIQHVAAGSPEPNAPADVLLGQLVHALREGATGGAYAVVATFALVELQDPESGRVSSAVHIGLEHRGGHCVDVFFPAVAGDDTTRLGEAFARDRQGAFFDCD